MSNNNNNRAKSGRLETFCFFTISKQTKNMETKHLIYVKLSSLNILQTSQAMHFLVLHIIIIVFNGIMEMYRRAAVSGYCTTH